MHLLLAAAAAAPGFDVEAATQAYLRTVEGAARAKSDAYFEGGYWLLLWGTAVSVLSSWLMLGSGWSASWRARAERITKRRWLQPALYAFPYVIVSSLIVLPWTIYTRFIREQQYGFMNLSFGAWLGEQATSLVVTIIVTALLFMAIFAVIRRAQRTWWLWAAATMTLFVTLGLLISPVLIAPLFNDYKQLSAGPLRDDIIGMARANDVPAEHVYVFDQSKQHKRISANVSGIGPTIRISLNDNLLNRSNPAEVKAVMGHELGHYVLNHVRNLIIFFALIFLLGFFLIWRVAPSILARKGAAWGVTGVSDPAAMPLLVALFSIYFFAMTPITNSLIRIQESQADAFGLDAAREPDGFASIAMKLSEYRKIEPGTLEETIFFDHPSGRTRVRMAMEWKARHLAERPKVAAPAPQPQPAPSRR